MQSAIALRKWTGGILFSKTTTRYRMFEGKMVLVRSERGVVF